LIPRRLADHLDVRRREAGVGEVLRHRPRRVAGVAGRVARVDLDELLEKGVELSVRVRTLRGSGQRKSESGEREETMMVHAEPS
jgi:hypothetical protein